MRLLLAVFSFLVPCLSWAEEPVNACAALAQRFAQAADRLSLSELGDLKRCVAEVQHSRVLELSRAATTPPLSSAVTAQQVPAESPAIP